MYHSISRPSKKAGKEITKDTEYSVQNSNSCYIICVRMYHPVTPILYSLHWLPVKARVKYKLLITTFKATHGMAPEYVSDIIQKYVPAYPLRSKNQALLVQPDLRLERFGRRSICYAAPQAWNKLPVSLKTMSSFPTVKQQLKSLLFAEYQIANDGRVERLDT